MRLSLFRRRGPAPADLPPVSAAAVPGPLHSGLTGDLTAFTAATALDGAQLLADVVTQTATKTPTATPEVDNRICAYKDPNTGQLACPPCYAEDVSVLWTSRTSDELPNGGLCAFCGVDVLIEPTEPGVVATEWPTREPRRIEPPLGGLAPLGMTPPLWKPGRYTVTYDRVGDHGRRGTGLPTLQPLTAGCLTVGDLAQQIVTDLRQLTGLVTTVMVDQAAGGGVILGEGGARLGTFAYERRGGTR